MEIKDTVKSDNSSLIKIILNQLSETRSKEVVFSHEGMVGRGGGVKENFCWLMHNEYLITNNI